MRYDSEHKQETRERVLTAASRALRSEGPDRIGVVGVMAQAGLTHGGFYAHFSSKNDLIAATIEHMFETTAKRMQTTVDRHPPREALATYIDFYLSMKHCASRDQGCPMAALASDLPRLDQAARQQFTAGMGRLLVKLTELMALAGIDDPESSAQSMRSEMVGALMLARVETDSKRAKQILAGSRAALKRKLGLEAKA